MDPVLTENPRRFSLFPIEYERLYDMYKDSAALIWFAEEIDLQGDLKDWESLSDDERHFIKHILAFFAASDGIVNENLAARFYSEVQLPEARAFYSMQMLIETIHAETYGLLIDTYVRDEAEKNGLFNAIETMPIVREKAEWALKWLGGDERFAERLMAFACVEGIFFSSSFCAIYWLKDRGLMPGLAFSNELISRDEGIHTDFAVELHNHLKPANRITAASWERMMREAVEIECKFACEALPVSLIGMNADHMSQYVRFCADRLSIQAGFEPIYEATNPFAFMERIALQGKTNFHEKRVSEYRRAGVGATSDKVMTIAFDEDF